MSSFYKIIISLLITFFSQNIYSQFNAPGFENITVKDGLPENSVTCIHQGYLGYFWFGTLNGLARYDVYSMQVFQPDENKNGDLKWKEVLTLCFLL
jgi:ligand-binding sensor domain-containing protein